MVEQLTLKDIDEKFLMEVNLVNRRIKENPYFWCGHFEGATSMLRRLLLELPQEAFPSFQPLTKEEIKELGDENALYKIKLFGKVGYISLDEPGQCYILTVQRSQFSFGTYQEPDEQMAAYFILDKMAKGYAETYRQYLK